MNKQLVERLLSDSEGAIAAFGESDTCAVIDWRDGAAEIIDAVIPFLPEAYLTVEAHGDAELAIRAGGREAQTVQVGEHIKQEDLFVALNRVLAPEYELRQYRPGDGDCYSLFLAPSKWWQSLAETHPAALEKYFLSAERLQAYTRKGFFERLFSKP
jgi:hypothetical protein